MNASIAEWVNFTAYEGVRAAKKELWLNLKQFHIGAMRKNLQKIIAFGGELLYQQYRQKQGYKRIRPILDLAEDHTVMHLEGILEKEDLYSFDAGTEACLSIPGILEYARAVMAGSIHV